MERLFILAFDHRTSLQKELFGTMGEVSSAQATAISSAKKLIFDGLEKSLAEGVDRRAAALLIDERFGAAVAKRAKEAGIVFALAVEKSGQKVFEFEYGNDFAAHIEAFDPTYCKALLRYNPKGDRALNQVQAQRLLRLSDWLRDRSPQLMVELLVPPEPSQLEAVGGDPRRYDRELRPALMREAIVELQDTGVDADVWKIEGLDAREDCDAVAALTRAKGRADVTCVVLGRGADDATVENWLRQAAGVSGYAGFAVGRTIWGKAVTGYLKEGRDRDQCTDDISRRYRHFIEVYSSRL
jgi:myo-inositol catabolism protein IolC